MNPNNQPSDATYSAIRQAIHPNTYIARCSLCSKTWRFAIGDPQICYQCWEKSNA